LHNLEIENKNKLSTFLKSLQQKKLSIANSSEDLISTKSLLIDQRRC